MQITSVTLFTHLFCVHILSKYFFPWIINFTQHRKVRYTWIYISPWPSPTPWPKGLCYLRMVPPLHMCPYRWRGTRPWMPAHTQALFHDRISMIHLCILSFLLTILLRVYICILSVQVLVVHFMCPFDWARGSQVKHYSGCVCEGVCGGD